MEEDYRMLLDGVIYGWMVNNNREPNHIIMNPNTWQRLGSQMGIDNEYKTHLTDYTMNNKYKGYNVYRSFDVKENEFILG